MATYKRDFNPPYKKKAATIHATTVFWENMRTTSDAAVKITGKEPTDTAYRGGIVAAFATNSDNGIAFIVQLPHAYQEGSDIEFHLHTILPVAGGGGGAENVKWDFTYSWANMGDVFPVETSVTKTFDVQSENADEHLYMEIGDIVGTGKMISSVIICSLTRDVGVANNYSGDIYLTELDFHYQRDTNGSREEDSKL